MSDYPFADNDPREGLFEHSNYLGLRNNVGDEGFGLGDLVTATNCDINDSLELLRRKGYSAPVVAGVDRSLWARGSVCLGVGSNSLNLINPDFSTTVLRSGLTSNLPLDYDVVADRVFYSNGVETGCVQGGQHRTWGLAVPGVATLAATGGTLLAGDYQIAVTYLRADGQESGTGRASAITLAAAGGIALSAIPISADPTVVAKNIYATSVGGQTLFLQGTIPNSQNTYTIAAIQHDAFPLLTQFMGPAPAGEWVGYWKGWMLVASGNRLYPSEHYAPELFDYRKSVPFLDRITMVAPLNNKTDCVWVGTTNQVVFMGGESPETWRYQSTADYGVIAGTLTFADGELFGGPDEDRGNTVAVFATTRGLCIGHSDGSFKNLTEQRYAYPSMDRGAAIVRRHRGIAQYLCTLEGVAVAGNVAA